MSQITISLSPELEREIRAFASKNGYGTLSDLVRDALRDKVDGGRGMTYWERALMVRVLQIQEAVCDPGRYGTNEQAIEALQNGYVSEYRRRFGDVNPEEVGADVTEFVHQVLACFDHLQRSAAELDDPELTNEVLFEGYDANTEGEYLGYAGYLYDTDRYRYVAGMRHGMNTHFPMRNAYRRMLTKWTEVSDGESHSRLLTREQVEEVLKARSDTSVPMASMFLPGLD